MPRPFLLSGFFHGSGELTISAGARCGSREMRYNFVNRFRWHGECRMSLILRKHQQNVLDTVAALQARISEIETDIRMRAMANSTSDCELRLLHRLKDEYSSNLCRYEGISEGFKAVSREAEGLFDMSA